MDAHLHLRNNHENRPRRLPLFSHMCQLKTDIIRLLREGRLDP